MTLDIMDARGRNHRWRDEPRRIVSLVPSDTYNLVALGLGGRLVGRTEYCVEPVEAVAGVPTVGGTKNADVDAIVALRPDLVIANQEENRKVDVERLDAAGLVVFVGFPKTVREGLEHTAAVASLFPSTGGDALEEAWARYDDWARREVAPVSTFVPIWMDPLMTVHGETFISDALELAGGRNVFSDRRRRYPLAADRGERAPVAKPGRDTRYPRVTLAELRNREPELVLLPDEPHAFGTADAAVFEGELGAAAEIRFCEGRDLMWYGLRAVEGLHRVGAILDEVRR